METAGVAGRLHGSGLGATSSLASSAQGDSLPQPVGFSLIVRAQPTLSVHWAFFPHQFLPHSASHSFLLHMLWFRLQQGYDHPGVCTSSLAWMSFITQEMLFLPPGFIPPFIPSSSKDLVFLIYTIDFFINPSGLWATLLAVYSRDFLYTGFLIFKGPDSFSSDY